VKYEIFGCKYGSFREMRSSTVLFGLDLDNLLAQIKHSECKCSFYES
jgi:hypothetical protein